MALQYTSKAKRVQSPSSPIAATGSLCGAQARLMIRHTVLKVVTRPIDHTKVIKHLATAALIFELLAQGQGFGQPLLRSLQLVRIDRQTPGSIERRCARFTLFHL